MPDADFIHTARLTTKRSSNVVTHTYLDEPVTAEDNVGGDLYEIHGPKVDVAMAKLFLSNSPRWNRDVMLDSAARAASAGGEISPMWADAIRRIWA